MKPIPRQRIKRLLAVLLCLMTASAFMPALTEAGAAHAAVSKSKPTKVYDRFLKKGSNLYCMLDASSEADLMKVNLKTSEVTKLLGYRYGEGGSAGNMHIKKGYIYCTISDDMSARLYRVKTNGNAKKRLASLVAGAKYQIIGSRIYYNAFDSSTDKGMEYGITKKMRLNGTNKKRAYGHTIRMKSKKSNVKGYSIEKKYKYTETDTSGLNDPDPEERFIIVTRYYDYYLRKPNGERIFLKTVAGWEDYQYLDE